MNALNWFCIQTKPGQEEGVSARLQSLPDLEVFNPRIRTRRFLRGRFREVIEELFPCYLFARFDLDRYYRTIRYTRGVRKIVGSPLGTPYTVDSWIIDSLRSREEGGLIRYDPPEFSPGDRVVVRDGPFKGLQGIFQGYLKPSERVVVLMNTLTYQARLEIERESLTTA
jgi:transcriptional antiterminator RfaH